MSDVNGTPGGPAWWLPGNLSNTTAALVGLLNASNSTNGTNSSPSPPASPDWNLDPNQWLWFASGVASAAATLWSFRTMDQHIRHNKHGVMRAYVVRILFMVPIYAMAAWLGLIQGHFSLWWNLVREVYEAFTIHSFIRFLIAYLGGEAEVRKLVLQRYEVGRRLIHHMWPCNKLCRGPTNPQRFMTNVKIGVMQYVVVQVLIALMTVYLTAVDRFKEGEWAVDNAYPWFVFAKNISQTWALYDLFWFYHSLQGELAGCNPFPKAMCIKGVVFFTYWQSVLFSILAYFGVLHPLESLTQNEPATALQDFTICFEMFIAAILHAVYFPHDEFNALPARGADSASLDVEERLPTGSPVPPPFESIRDELLQHVAESCTTGSGGKASPLSSVPGSPLPPPPPLPLLAVVGPAPVVVPMVRCPTLGDEDVTPLKAQLVSYMDEGLDDYGFVEPHFRNDHCGEPSHGEDSEEEDGFAEDEEENEEEKALAKRTLSSSHPDLP
eukprot:EG_transcript_7646